MYDWIHLAMIARPRRAGMLFIWKLNKNNRKTNAFFFIYESEIEIKRPLLNSTTTPRVKVKHGVAARVEKAHEHSTQLTTRALL